MAEFSGALYTEQTQGFKPTTGNTPHNKIVFRKIPIVAPAAVATSDTINAYILPVGSVVHPELSRAYWSGTGATSVTISLGDVTDSDRYMLTEDISSAAVVDVVHSATAPAGVSSPYTVTETDKVLIITAVAVGTWTAASDAGYIELAVELP